MRHRESFDSRVSAECAHHQPHVVADGLDAQLELVGDLRGRPAAREHVQDLVLAWRQVRVRVRRRRRLEVRDDAEHADDSTPIPERDRADLGLNALAVGVEQDDACVRRTFGAEDLAREGLSRLPRLLRCDHRRLLPPPDVSDEVQCCGIEPTDDPEPVATGD